MHTQHLTENEKNQREKDMFLLFLLFAIGLGSAEMMIIAQFIGSDHSWPALAATILFGGVVWCLLVVMAGCARQCWRNIRSLRSY